LWKNLDESVCVVYFSTVFFNKKSDPHQTDTARQSAVGEVDFCIFWIFNFLQFTIGGKNNSKSKVEKVFFFIFISSYAEMSFLNKKSLNRVKTIFFGNTSIWGSKICNFTLISTRFVGTSQKNRVLWLKLLIRARYKDKKHHFEISVKLRIF
jgi:hypothetical protein